MLSCKSWNRKLSIGICVLMRYGAHFTYDDVIFNYYIDGRILMFISSDKEFGVFVDSRLWWFHEHYGLLFRKLEG